MRRRHREKNFLNDPETWELLQKIHALAEPLGLTLLPEIHAAYDEKIYETLAEKGYATYDFFLPGLVIDAIENRRGTHLAAWAKEIERHAWLSRRHPASGFKGTASKRGD